MRIANMKQEKINDDFEVLMASESALINLPLWDELFPQEKGRFLTW